MKSKHYFTFFKFIFQLIIFLGITENTIAQIYGCTDPLSQNFNPLAEINDGSCTYVSASISNINSISLSDSLNESSGLIQWNGGIWSHNDNDDNYLYAINPNSGTVDSTILISGVFNDDWEEISQDVNYIYLGDFGNNSHGNRTDLHILRILKNSFPTNLQIDTIYFNYPQQIDFSNQPNNSTNFDCESFVVSSDSIFLFTKRWGDKRTMLYGFPKLPGNYAAQLKDSFDIQGLITGATFLENEKLVSICGYSSTLQPFVWLLYDFPGTNFFKGNKRKISLPLAYTQVEGITTLDGLNYYASNEYFINGPVVSPQRFHSFNLSIYLEGYLTGNYAQINQIEKDQIAIYPNPSSGKITVQTDANFIGHEFSIYQVNGKLIQNGILSGEKQEIELIEKGIYFLKMDHFLSKIIIE
jgi:hypothetical protein